MWAIGHLAPRLGIKTLLSGFRIAADSAIKSTAEKTIILASLSSIALLHSPMLSPT